MPWFRFDQAFDWKPQPNVTIAYKAGDLKLVTTPCAHAAKAKGRGQTVKKPQSEKRHGDG